MRVPWLSLAFVVGCAMTVGDEYSDELWITDNQDMTPAELEDASQMEDPTEPPEATDDLDDPAELDELLPPGEAEVLTIAAAGKYQNPVAGSCADPGVIKTTGADGKPEFYAVCTGNGYPTFKSRDLVTWKSAGHIFNDSTKPAWIGKNNWAPEVHKIGTGYVAYFAAYSQARGRMCIGAARASAISGPYTDIGHPLVCDGNVGLIDPNVFTDADGRHFLYYKTEGNAKTPQEKTIIYGHELKPNGIGFIGQRHRLLQNTLAWEGDVTEAPWVMKRGTYYYMFYSGYRYCDKRYGVGVARAKSPLGPFRKRSAPIVHSSDTWIGPGHNAVVRAGGAAYMVYHAYQGAHVCGQDGGRKLLVDRIGWQGGWPFVNNGTPSKTLRAAPTIP
jgi:beta-xylosidase